MPTINRFRRPFTRTDTAADPAPPPSAAPPSAAPPPASLLEAALRLAADSDRWRPHLDFDPDRRYHRRLIADEHHEAWLLTWLPGQGTDWHDHGASSGAFVVLQGVLVERIARHGIVRGVRHVRRPGESRVVGPDHAHRISNDGTDPAVSLHVYTPRLEVQHDYVSDDGILRRIATRRAGVDW